MCSSWSEAAAGLGLTDGPLRNGTRDAVTKAKYCAIYTASAATVTRLASRLTTPATSTHRPGRRTAMLFEVLLKSIEHLGSTAAPGTLFSAEDRD
jgi:hypothetical protein